MAKTYGNAPMAKRGSRSIDYHVRSSFNYVRNPLLKKVTRMLSENSRANISEISSKLGVSRKTVADKIKQLEKEYNAKFVPEFSEQALKLTSPHLTLVKFAKVPDLEKIKEIFSESEIPQLVATIKGDYDLLIYSNYFSNFDYAKWDKKTRIRLSEYDAVWRTSEVVHKQLGFFPL
ncbi:MAG: winged helix-turn-helix transcriptional regulator, partial [Candidatus Micrarchaeia archaeon]